MQVILANITGPVRLSHTIAIGMLSLWPDLLRVHSEAARRDRGLPRLVHGWARRRGKFNTEASQKPMREDRPTRTRPGPFPTVKVSLAEGPERRVRQRRRTLHDLPRNPHEDGSIVRTSTHS